METFISARFIRYAKKKPILSNERQFLKYFSQKTNQIDQKGRYHTEVMYRNRKHRTVCFLNIKKTNTPVSLAHAYVFFLLIFFWSFLQMIK